MLVKWFNKVLAGKADDLCSVSWSYMVEGKTLSGCPLTPQHMCTSAHMRTHSISVIIQNKNVLCLQGFLISEATVRGCFRLSRRELIKILQLFSYSDK